MSSDELDILLSDEEPLMDGQKPTLKKKFLSSSIYTTPLGPPIEIKTTSSPSSDNFYNQYKIAQEEGELETLIRDYHQAPPDPRSGPPYRQSFGGMEDSFGWGKLRYKDDFLEDDSRPSFQDKRTQDDLKNGRIPVSVRESYRLIDDNDPATAAFQKKMAAITERLFKGNLGATTRDFRFVLSDVPGAEGCILTGAKPPIIIVSKGAIEKFDTEDELAALLAHELTHQNIFDQIGGHKNSNPEESSADAWAVKLLQDAGYVPSAMLTMLEKVHPSYARRRKSAIEAREPHPSYETRVRHVEDALAYLESKKPLNTILTSMDEDLRQISLAAQHTPFLPTILAKENYANLSLEGKVTLLCDLWDDLLIRMPFDEHKTRYSDFESAIKELAKSAKETPRILDPLLERIVIMPETRLKTGDFHESGSRRKRINSLFSTLSYDGYKTMQYDDGNNGWLPIGPLADLRIAMECFMKAETLEDAQMNAELINSIGGKFTFLPSSIFSNIHWPDFEIPNIKDLDGSLRAGEPCELPWRKLKIWAKDSPEVAKALNQFNITEPEASLEPAKKPNKFDLFDIDEVLAGKDRKIITKSIDWSYYGYTPSKHLNFDDDGRIVSHNIRRIKREAPVEKQPVRLSTPYDDKYLKARDKEADELLPNVNWRMLEKDFWWFVGFYEEQLTPQVTTSEGGDKFQKVFCEKCQKLLQKKPEKYKPLLAKFFSNNLLAENKDDKDRKTIFSMMYDFEKKYRVHTGVSGDRVSKHQYGLSTDSPYLELMQKCSIPAQDQFTLMSKSRWRNAEGKEPEDFIGFDFRTKLGYKKPQSASELYQAVERINDFCKDRDYYGTERELRKALINTEVYAYLKLKKEEVLDLEKLSELSGTSFKEREKISDYLEASYILSFAANSLMEKKPEEHVNLFAQLMDRQIGFMFQDSISNEKTPEDLIKNYQILCFGDVDRTAFFDRRPKEKAAYEGYIRKAIDKLEEPLRKTELCRTLLCKSSLKDPEFRSWAVETWVNGQAAVLRNGLAAKNKAMGDIEGIADDIIENAQMGQSVNMLNGLLEEIQAQEDISFMVRDKLLKQFIKKGTKGNLAAAANDFVLERIGDEPKVRDDLLEFLISPLSAETTQKFMATMMDRELSKKYCKDIFYIFQHDKDSQGIDIPQETRINSLRNIYKNFWALPFAARALYIESVLFPTGENSQEKFDKAVNYAMDKILPSGQAYTDQARLVLTTHLEQCSKPLKRLTYAALITASEKRENTTEALRPGQVLSQVLSRSGAAGGKILQAIHSYLQSLPDADADLIQLRKDLKSSKSNYNKPFRWDMMKRFKDCFRPDPNKSTPTVGAQLGAGSYGYTVELIYPDKSTALTMARDDVAEESHYQFGFFKKTAEKLSQIDSMWKPLINILGNAQGMSAIESDFEIAAKQIKAAEKLYNGISVSVDGYDFKISTAGLVSFGKEFKETDLAHGEHFLDLPAATENSRKYRRAAAKAILATELHIWLRGGPFDYDRHGAQCKVNGEPIKMFDHGSMPYDLEKKKVFVPSTEDKDVLGKVIAEAYVESKKSTSSVTDILVDKLTDTEVYGSSARYLECFKRGMLALSDYIQDIGDTPGERNSFIQDALLQSVKTGLADRHIISSIADVVESNTEHSAKKSSLVLKDRRSSAITRLGSQLSLAFGHYAPRAINQALIGLNLKTIAPR